MKILKDILYSTNIIIISTVYWLINANSVQLIFFATIIRAIRYFDA